MNEGLWREMEAPRRFLVEKKWEGKGMDKEFVQEGEEKAQ